MCQLNMKPGKAPKMPPIATKNTRNGIRKGGRPDLVVEFLTVRREVSEHGLYFIIRSSSENSHRFNVFPPVNKVLKIDAIPPNIDGNFPLTSSKVEVLL